MIVWYPGSVDDVQHRGLRRLRVNEEEHRARQVHPGIRHPLRFIQQWTNVAIVHGIGERAVVVVIGELFCTAAKIAQVVAVFIFTAGPGLPLPDIRVTLPVVAAFLTFNPAHFTEINQRLAPLGNIAPAFVAAGFLSKVSKHGCQRFTAYGIAIASVGIGPANRREFTNSFQKVRVGIFCRTHREQILPILFGQDAFHTLHVCRVGRQTWLDFFNLAIRQRLNR